jgi:hypothetical protein
MRCNGARAQGTPGVDHRDGRTLICVKTPTEGENMDSIAMEGERYDITRRQHREDKPKEVVTSLTGWWSIY